MNNDVYDQKDCLNKQNETNKDQLKLKKILKLVEKVDQPNQSKTVFRNRTRKKPQLRWLNTVLRAVSGNLPDGACFKLDKQTWRLKKQWYTDDDFSKSTHQNFVIFGRIVTFIVF